MTAPSAEKPLRLSLLGGLRIESASGSLGPAGQQPRRIGVAALAAIAGPEGISGDQLLALFWPEQDEASARNAKKQAIHALRRDLGARDLFLGDRKLRLNPDIVDVDLWRFNAAIDARDWDAAIAIYRGPLLHGVQSLGSAELEHWLDMERDRAAHRFATAIEAAAGQLAAVGQKKRALDHWYRLATIDPMNGRAAEAIARGLATSGDRNAAVQHAQAHITRVSNELGLPAEPGIAGIVDELSAPVTPLRASFGGGLSFPASKRAIAARQSRRFLYAGIAVALTVGAVLLISRSGATGSVPNPPALAVLPFDNLGPSSDEYFADGLTDEITDRLANISGLRVISRKSAAFYKDSRKSSRTIGDELQADYLLDGTVRWQRNPDGTSRVRISQRLTRTSDDARVWTKVHDAPLGEVFDAQAAIATEVAQALRINVLGAERERLAGKAPTSDMEAHDYVLRAKAVLARNTSERDLLVASQLYRNALQQDSAFVDAWAGLSRAASELYFSYYDRSPQRLMEAGAAAERAVRLDPQSRNAHLALGYYHYYGFLNYERALREFEIARSIAPTDGDVLEAIGFVERRQGHWTSAIAHLERALAADPRAFAKAYVLGETYLKVGRYRDAERALLKSIELSHTGGESYVALALLHLNEGGSVERARVAIVDGLRHAGPVSMMRASMLTVGTMIRVFPTEFSAALQGLDAGDFGGQPEIFYLSRGLACDQMRGERPCGILYDSARAILEPKAASRGDPLAFYHALLSMAHAGMGNSGEAVHQATLAVQLLPTGRDASNGPNVALQLAQSYAQAGKKEQALRELQRILGAPSLFNANLIGIDPVWSQLRDSRSMETLRVAQSGMTAASRVGSDQRR